MVLRSRHQLNVLSVHKGEHRYLAACHEFLDDHLVARFAELVILHDRAHTGLGLLKVLADEDALPESKAVCLEDSREFCLRPKVRDRCRRVRKCLIGGGRDAVLLHQILGKRLASLDNGGIFPGAEDAQPGGLQRVNQSGAQRIILAAHHQIDPVLLRKRGLPVEFHHTDRYTLRDLCDAGIARRTVQLLAPRTSHNCLCNGVFPAASADQKNLHASSLLSVTVKHSPIRGADARLCSEPSPFIF